MNNSKWALIGTAVSALLLGCSGSSFFSTPTPPAGWYPDGFSLCVSDTPDIACRSLGLRTCEFGWKCETVEVIPYHDCESMYVEIRELATDNTMLGYTNDDAGRVDAGQKAVMEFTYTEKGMATREITEAACFSI